MADNDDALARRNVTAAALCASLAEVGRLARQMFEDEGDRTPIPYVQIADRAIRNATAIATQYADRPAFTLALVREMVSIQSTWQPKEPKPTTGEVNRGRPHRD